MSTAAYCPICYQSVTDQMLDGAGWCPDHGRVFMDYHRPKAPIEIVDADGAEIRRGMMVVDALGREQGHVVQIREPEGDYADDGTPVSIGPLVIVNYHDTGEERWGCRPDVHGDRYTCDDIVVRP